MKPKILTNELLARYVTTTTANAKEVTAATRRCVGNAKRKKNVRHVAFLRQHSRSDEAGKFTSTSNHILETRKLQARKRKLAKAYGKGVRQPTTMSSGSRGAASGQLKGDGRAR